MYSKMLIPLDGSKVAEQVLPYARLLTHRFAKPVELIAMIDTAALTGDGLNSEGPAFGSWAEKIARESESYLQSVAQAFEAGRVACIVRDRPPAQGIIERGEADVAALIAMATHGRSGVHRWLLGSVAEKVLRATVNPLLLVRASEDGASETEALLRSVLVPLDGSALAESVLPMVAGLAKPLDLEIILLRVFELPMNAFVVGHGYYAFDMTTFMTIIKEQAREYLDQKAAELQQLGVGKVSCVTRQGLAADEIIKLAGEAPDRLVALCSHGRSGVNRWVLGSVTETVVRHASNPVLVLRPK